MAVVHLIFGPQGAGKSTYAQSLAEKESGTRFSIDEWMVQLYGPDVPKPLDFDWIMARVKRCEAQIWFTARDVARNGGSVILDLGFTRVVSRTEFTELAEAAELAFQLHYIDAPHDVRRNRVMKRNTEKGETFSLEVTPAMFDFMEKRFEPPSDKERSAAIAVTTKGDA